MKRWTLDRIYCVAMWTMVCTSPLWGPVFGVYYVYKKATGTWDEPVG